MDERTLARMRDNSRTGMGAAYPENQRLSMGLSQEEAEEAAREARGKTAETASGESAADKPDITPPDAEEATQEELDTAKQILTLVRDVQKLEDTEDPMADPLQSDKLRKSIEKDLTPINLEMLFFHGRVTQEVLLFNGELKLVLRTLSSEEMSLVKRWMDNWIKVQLSPQQKFKLKSQVQCALQIASMNSEVPGGADIPAGSSVLQPKFSEIADLFERKLSWFLRLNPDLLDLIVLNIAWFQQRVRRVVANNAYVGQEIKKS